MSFSIRNIREISNDPLTKFTNQLAKKLSKFLNQNQIEQLENKEDIYSSGEDVDVVLRLGSFISTKYFAFATQYFPPVEPDFDKLTLWIKGMNLGNMLHDFSGFDNQVFVHGDPVLTDGDPFDYGIHTGGIKSIALRLNRPGSFWVNDEFCEVDDNTRLQVSGIATGISIFTRFKFFAFNQQESVNRTISEKIDDSTPNNAHVLTITTDGRVRFDVKRAGTWYRRWTIDDTLDVGLVYDIWATYSVSGNTIHIYVNGVDMTLTDPGSNIETQSELTDHQLWIGRRGKGGPEGMLYGDLYDYEFWREKVVSAAEVGFHYTNKWTIANIPFGQVMVPNYWATYMPAPQAAYTTTGYTTIGYNT